VVFSEHAFAVYPLATQAVGATAVVAPARDWGHDLEAMRERISGNTRVVFVANPNNPTGTWVESAALESFIRDVPSHVIVVVDEAYFEYASHPDAGFADYPNALEWVARYPNLIVTRTFSKAYGLAGLRVGYAVSSPEVADLLNRVRQPFNVNSAALLAAEVALADRDHLERGIRLNREQMKYLTRAFDELGLEYIPSAGNFVSVDVARSADEVYEALLHRGVIVRPVANYGMPGFLRVTVGHPEENERFVEALKNVLTASP
jgi:histidinol-phosphate aminotransferase